MRSLLPFVWIGFVFLCYSCEKQYTFSQLQSIPESGWTYENILKYEFEVEDTNALYDLYLEVDYNTSFSYQNIYVNVFTGMSEDNMNKTQLSLDLSNNLGIWKGDCDNEVCTYLLPLQKSIYFEKPGKQFFWIEQYSRSPIIKDVKSIRFVGEIIGAKK